MSKNSTFEILKTFEGKWNILKSFDNGNYIRGQANIKNDNNILVFATRYSSPMSKDIISHKFFIAQQGKELYKIRENHNNIRINTKLDENALKGHIEYQEWDRWFETDYLFYLDTNVFKVNKTITTPDGRSQEDTIFLRINEEDIPILGLNISEA